MNVDIIYFSCILYLAVTCCNLLYVCYLLNSSTTYGTAHLQGNECPRETHATLEQLAHDSRVHAKLLAVEYPAESSENHKLLGW